jgi:hypothetical protein
MQEYDVTVTVEFQGVTVDFQLVEDGWSLEDAKENAIERVRNNMLTYVSNIEEK